MVSSRKYVGVAATLVRLFPSAKHTVQVRRTFLCEPPRSRWVIMRGGAGILNEDACDEEEVLGRIGIGNPDVCAGVGFTCLPSDRSDIQLECTKQ
jgi:hypothetical protein